MSQSHPVHLILLMGVAGCGKSTVGHALAKALGWPFRDADTFHPAANIEKMSRAIPLSNDDRWPWLDAIAAWMDDRMAHHQHGIVSCSALKHAYRERLIGVRSGIGLVYLKGRMELIAARLGKRRDHFMPAALLESQFAALQEPDASERALVVSIEAPPEQIVAEIVDRFALRASRGAL